MSTWKSAAAKLGILPSPQTNTHLPETYPTILIVDDDSATRDVIRSLFEESDYPLLEANNGAEALHLMRESHDRFIVLLDSSMPGVDGEGVLRTVLHDRTLRRRHAIVFVSAIARLSRRLSLQRLLFTFSIEVVAKPFNILDLEQAVERARAKLL